MSRTGIVAVLPGKFLKSLRNHTSHQVGGLFGDTLIVGLITEPLKGSTIGEGGDTTISSPGRSPKQPLPGLRLHDPLHGRQACPKFIAFDLGVGQICPW